MYIPIHIFIYLFICMSPEPPSCRAPKRREKGEMGKRGKWLIYIYIYIYVYVRL